MMEVSLKMVMVIVMADKDDNSTWLFPGTAVLNYVTKTKMMNRYCNDDDDGSVTEDDGDVMTDKGDNSTWLFPGTAAGAVAEL